MRKITSLFIMMLILSFYPVTQHNNGHEAPEEPLVVDTVKPELKKPFRMTAESKNALTCLVENIYYEANMESYEGKLAVATVTMNRVSHKQFPNSVCKVVYQQNSRGCQFSWVCENKKRINIHKYPELVQLAREVLHDSLRLEEIDNALYFHNPSVKPNWSSFAQPIARIDNHIFYVLKHDKKES